METQQRIELRDRTVDFALAAVDAAEELKSSSSQFHLADQLVRSATSVGAHYREATRARTDAEFVSKLDVAIQEADECQYWLELIARAGFGDREKLADLYREADELIAIQTSIVTDVKSRRD